MNLDQSYRNKDFWDDTVVNCIIKNYISLKDEDIKTNNQHLQKIILNGLIPLMQEDDLFKDTYKNINYAGSFFKGTKVGKPDEYDLDLRIRLPLNYRTLKVETNHKNYGYVKVKVDDISKLPKWETHSKVDYDQLRTCDSVNNKSTSKLRVVLSQCLALLAICSAKYSHGCFMGLTIVMIPLLHKQNAEIIVTIHELTWFGSSYFMPSVGAILGGILAHRIGTRFLMMMCAILFISAGLIFHWTSNVIMLSCAQAIAGITGGLIKAPGYTYVAEITQPHLRSTLMAFLNLSVLSGLFVTVTMSGFMDWRLIVLINLTLPITLLLLVFWIPESPYWLACNDRFYEAQLSLAWFRGWTNAQSVRTEFRSMTNNLKNFSFSKSSQKNNWKMMLKPYLSRSFYMPLMTICFMFFINDFGGTFVIKTYAMLVFEEIHSPINVHTAATILSAIRLVGAISIIFTVHFFGKRKLIFFSVLGASSSFIVAAVFNFLIDQSQLTSHVYFWIPSVAVILSTLATASGIEKVVYLLTSELYPIRLRQVGAGVGHLASSLIAAILNKTFLYMINAFTMTGVFIIFSIVDLIGFITIYNILPETEGKTLSEVEEYYSGKHNVKNKNEDDDENINY